MGLFCVLGLVGAGRGGLLFAQDEATPTLHVYANLIQIPVLVLSPDRRRMAPVAAGRFSVSLDAGPKFRATHVRLEGDDPISLSILLDVSGSEAELLSKIAGAIAGLAPLSLRPQDRVSIYALDCSLMVFASDVAAERGRLKRGVDEALQSWRERGHGPGCQQSVHLWDALTYLTGKLYSLPGRRVILAVTDGKDKGSTHTWRELKTYAQDTGVAIFGLNYAPFVPGSFGRPDEDGLFVSVCELSGGMVFTANESNVAQTLKRFTETLRERYIVEFPRPSNSTPGQHDLLIAIEDSKAFIRPAGISVPPPDPALLADPSTVPSDPSNAPELGKRRVLAEPR